MLLHHHALHFERVGTHFERARVLLDGDHQCAPRVEAHDGGAAARARGHHHSVHVVPPDVGRSAGRVGREQRGRAREVDENAPGRPSPPESAHWSQPLRRRLARAPEATAGPV